MQTLTSAEPGWYLCSFAVDPREERVRYWNGKQLCIDNSIPHRPVSCKAAMVNFQRLHTEAEVAELRDQLTTCDHENSDLASKLKSMESQDAELRRQVEELGRKWKAALAMLPDMLDECIIERSLEKSLDDRLGIAEAFNAAVTKSMESPNG